MDSDGQPLWPRSPASRLWLRRKLKARQGAAADKDPLDLLFDRQREARDAPGRFKAFLVGRRGGKTTTIVWDLAQALLTEDGTSSIFVAQTSETARELCWVPLEQAKERYGWPIRFDNSKYIAYGPKGARLTVKGSETMRDLEKRRGPGYRRIRIDECGAIRPTYLRYMVEDIFEPMMMDSKETTIWLSGTPNPTPNGYFHDVTTGRVGGWETKHWTYKNNPHLDQDFVPELLKRRNWTIDTPKFKREYLAEWATDPGRVVFRFSRERNVIRALPPLAPGDHWVYFASLDFGFGDATACVVLAWAKTYGRAVYVVDAWAERGLLPHEYEPKLRVTYDKWRPIGIIGDVNAIGKPYQMFWNRAHPGLEMMAAQKLEKRAALEFVSDALASASFGGDDVKAHYGLAVLESVDPRLAEQLTTLLWDEDREDIEEGQDDDLAMAMVYGWRMSPAFLNATQEPPPPVDVRGTTHAFWPPTLSQEPALLAKAFSGAFRRKR